MHLSPFEIGQRFIQYYQQHGFEVIPRCSLLDPSLPMTFVMSAGRIHIDNTIAQGKYRTGASYSLLQPCFRHYDLEKVGMSPVHLSLFEMAGAYHFGQADREWMLRKIWHFLTKELQLEPERLWATWFAGGTDGGHEFEADTESLESLETIGFPSSRIVGLGIDGNLLKQGAGAPGTRQFRKCGPMVELFWDRGEQYRCGDVCRPGMCKCNRFIEISNTLFVYWQFDQSKHSLALVGTPFTETVIGTERVAMAVQECSSVFETNDLAPIIQMIRGYYAATEIVNMEKWRQSERVIVDHLRALAFLIADGALPPGKCGRRRIIRILIRGVLTHQKILGITTLHFPGMVIDEILNCYQQYYSNCEFIRTNLLRYIDEERERFERTLSTAQTKLDAVIGRISRNSSISGQQALHFVKDHGYPLPLLQQRLHRKGIYLDQHEYHKAYTHWRKIVK